MPAIGAVAGINPKSRGDPGAGRFRDPLFCVQGPCTRPEQAGVQAPNGPVRSLNGPVCKA
jgi:hypothetical protein